MFSILAQYVHNEDGAVTIDWVVLTAAAVGLGLIVTTQIGGATENVGSQIGENVAGIDVGYGNSLD